jgi:hypothetical protein
MAYARFSDHSDVYVFLGGSGPGGRGPLALVCLKCALPPSEIFTFSAQTTVHMIDHLDQHRAAGHSVPDDAFADLRRDQDENDAEIAGSPDSN